MPIRSLLFLTLLFLAPGCAHAPSGAAALDRERAPAGGVADPGDPDSDGDGLSDFQEVHKYLTDPGAADTDGDGIPDGDWHERREYTYTIRSVVRLLPPYDRETMNDDYQDVRVLADGEGSIELEVIHYSLNTNGEAIRADPGWREGSARLKEFLAPGITTNWDEGMREDLMRELRGAGIDPDGLTDRRLVEEASRWLMESTMGLSQFTTMFVHFPQGRPEIYPGLESAFRSNRGDPDWSEVEQMERDLLGKEMYYHRVRGSCTSTAVYLTTALRALGVPTRMILAVPVVDASDPAQRAMVEAGLRHPEVRRVVLEGLAGLGGSFAAHTFNEVFVGGRWRRLNDSRLGQNTLGTGVMGLLTHVHTFRDLAEANLAATWGKRYGLLERDETFRFSNPYRALEVSDRIGIHAKEPRTPMERGHRQLTITRAYWFHSEETDPWMHEVSRDRSDLHGHLIVHVEEAMPDQGTEQYVRFIDRADPNFLLRSEAGVEVKGQVPHAVWYRPSRRLKEMEILIPPEEFARMEEGVPFSLQPVNSRPGYVWQVQEGVAIRRVPSAK